MKKSVSALPRKFRHLRRTKELRDEFELAQNKNQKEVGRLKKTAAEKPNGLALVKPTNTVSPPKRAAAVFLILASLVLVRRAQ